MTNGAHLAPVVGAFVGEYAGWRWCNWVLAILLGGSWIVNVFCLPETLHQRGSEKQGSWARLLRFNAVPAEKPSIRHLAGCFYILKPPLLLTALYYSTAFAAGATLSTATAATALQEVYHFTTPQTGLATSLPAVIGSILGEFLAGTMSDKMLTFATAQHMRTADPETRLHATWPGAAFLPSGVIIQGLCLQYQTHWAGPVAGIGVAAFGLQIVSTPVLAYLVDCYEFSAAEVSAVVNFGRGVVSFALVFYIVSEVDVFGLWAC